MKSRDKRDPTLADLMIAQIGSKITKPSNFSANTLRGVQHKIRMAEKFVFDTSASERMGLVLRDVPELLVEQIQFARAPFDLCWVEYDSDVLFRMLNPDQHNPADESRDIRVGALIDHNRILVCSQTAEGELCTMPFAYHLNTEWTLQDQLNFADKMKISRLGIDVWLWGAVAAKFMNEGKQRYLRVLRDTNMVECLFRDEDLSFDDAARIMGSCTGDFKNHIAALLLLNQPSLTQYVKVPSTRGWIKHKPRPYMAYNTVRMALDPVPKVRTLSDNPSSGELRRRHRVRGHYCHNKAARQALINHTCEHYWQPTNKRWDLINTEVGDDVENWLCGKCSGKRWWKEQHERGDASKGYVDHEYEVSRYEKAPD